MKKAFRTMISACSILAAIPFSAVLASAEGTAVNASLANTAFQAAQDQDFTTTVYMPKGSNVMSFEAALEYDSSAVTLKSVTACKSENGSIQVNQKNGKIYLSFSATQNQTEQIDVAQVTFHVNDDLAAGTYDFLSLCTTETNNASSETESGDPSQNTIKDGFSDLTIYQYGDADLNGKIQSQDVSYIKQYVVQLRDLSDTSKMYANAFLDFEEDGTTPKVNSRDAGIIQQKVVHMDVTLGNRVDVMFYDADGNIFAKKSVKSGSALTSVPDLPERTGYAEHKWSLKANEYVPVDFSKITADMDIYAYYGEEDPYIKLTKKVIEVLDIGFTEEGKYITDDFQLPYKSNFGSFNMLTSSEFQGLDIVWGIKSGVLAQSVNISKEYVVDVPTGADQIPYTTWVDFTAHIFFNGVEYGVHTFPREIKGKIDMPGPDELIKVVKSIPETIPEHYRLPGYVSLELQRLNYDVKTVQNVDIQWSVVKNTDGSMADKRVLDTTNNELIRLKDETNVTLQCDFIFDGHVIYTERITRTIPEKPIEEQVEYAKQYIRSFVPSVISGETYFTTKVPLYDLTVSWISDIESGKVVIGRNETVNGTVYKVIDVGEKAGYMEWAKVYANIERSGDERFKRTGLEFDVQLAGNSTEISTDKIPDVSLYNTLKNIFDKKYGNKDGILTEEEIYDTKVMEKLGYELDLSNKGITCLSGIKYLKYYKKLDLSGNDLSGTNAGLGELASLNYLEQLSLSNCKIETIPASVFSSKALIEGIDLSYNCLKNVNFLTLTDSRTQQEVPFTELKELFLQGNYISDISNLSFVNDSGELVSRIPNVTVLTLSRDLNYYEYTTGTKLRKKVFKPIEEYEYDITTPMDIAPIGLMPKLTTLWLANNYISDISPLANCKLLATLDLAGNDISATSAKNGDGLEPLSKLQSLVCLKLDRNKIQTVKSLRRLIYLEILSLSENQIGSVAGTLDALSQLTYLDLDKNELTTFDAGSFPHLQRLYLEDQHFGEENEKTQTLEQVLNLKDTPEMTELRLNYNKLDSDSIQSISNLKKLTYLSLSDNVVVDLAFLKDLVQLTHLELANCQIRQSYDAKVKDAATGEYVVQPCDNIECLNGLTELLILDLSNNADIHDVSALNTLTKLGVFYINNVELESAAAVRSMTKLQYLSMQNSGLTDFSFLNTLNQLEFLNLAGHKFDAFDFRNIRNYNNLVALFLDSAVNTEAINLNTFVNKQSLRYMTLSNMKVGSIDDMPDMDEIVYLGLRNTGISDFNGSYNENDGYIYPITRFSTLKFLDVADNPELFTKKNLEMLYDFVGKPEQKIAILLYSNKNDAPKDYIPGLMDPNIEVQRIKNDINFGDGGTDISAAMSAGYELQSVLNEYDIEWKLNENDNYYVKDGKLYFKNTDTITENMKLSLTMDVLGLYYREQNPNTKPATPVTFNASIQTAKKKEPTGEKKFVKREETTSTESKLEGWTRDDSKTILGYGEWGSWTGWNKTAVTANDLREVETKTEKEYSGWGGWSDWSGNAVSGNDLRQVETKQDPYTVTQNETIGPCASWYDSIVDALDDWGRDFSFSERKRIAELNGISNYSGTYSQNVTLLDRFKNGELIVGTYTETRYNTLYRYRTRSLNDVTYYRYRERTKVPATYYFYRDIYEDVIKEVISGMTLIVEK